MPMPEFEEQIVENALRQVYSPLKGLGELLADFLSALGEAGQGHFTVYLPEPPRCQQKGLERPVPVALTSTCGGFVKGLCSSCPLLSAISALNGGQPYTYACHVHPSPCNLSLSVPIRYQREEIGFIACRNDAANDAERMVTISRAIATRIAYLCQRFELNRCANERLGRDLWIFGTDLSHQIGLDVFLEKASQVDIPVMIFAEPGSMGKDVAYASHLLSSHREGPFVNVKCSLLNAGNSLDELTHRFSLANGGTIFLDSVDVLYPQLQIELADVLRSGLGARWATDERGKQLDVRIVAAANLDGQAATGSLVPALLRELSLLSTKVEPLRHRRRDIGHLMLFFLHSSSGGRISTVSGAAARVFESYPWPGNVAELQTVAARLATMASGMAITLEDVLSHAPHLTEGGAEVELPGEEPAKLTHWESKRAGVARSLAKMCRGDLSEQDLQAHPAVVKAIRYLVENLEDKLSLDQLARHACVSGSHLSWLFNQAVGTSPMAFLTLLRIERSKKLLQEERSSSITEIAFRSGFGDLRHFERMFKRSMELSPKEFRAALHTPRSEDRPHRSEDPPHMT